jgi:hypothetical protein
MPACGHRSADGALCCADCRRAELLGLGAGQATHPCSILTGIALNLLRQDKTQARRHTEKGYVQAARDHAALSGCSQYKFVCGYREPRLVGLCRAIASVLIFLQGL